MKTNFALAVVAAAMLCTCALSLENAEENLYRKGMKLAANGSYDEAIKAFNDASELNQSYAPAWSAKGALLYQMDSKDRAKAAFEKALDIYNETLMNIPQDAETWIERSVALAYMGMWNESISSRQKALEIFNKTIERNPDDVLAWSGKAAALSGMGRHSESIQALEMVINLTSDSATIKEAWLGKAVSYAEGLQEFNKSQDAWDRALDMTSDNDIDNLSIIWGCKAKTFEMAGRFEEALAAYQKVIDLKANDTYAWIGKGFILINLGLSVEAEAAFDNAIKICPASVHSRAWFGKGEALLAQKKYREAIRAYDNAIEGDFTLGAAWNGKSIALKALGRNADADLAFSKAEELNESVSYF